jgi:phage terminase large subunit-like protein
MTDRVARWFIYRPKIPIWVYLEGLGMENVITYVFIIFYDHRVYFMGIG